MIAATSEDLPAAVQAGRFRRRSLPSPGRRHARAAAAARSAARTCILLAEHFLGRVCEDYGLPAKALAADARAALLAHDWPGNVRELANVLERAALLADEPRLTARGLGLPARARRCRRAPAGPGAAAPAEDVERRGARGGSLDVLRETEWNFTRAAVRLGVPRNTLRYRDRAARAVARERGGPAPRRPAARGREPRRSASRPAAAARAAETRRVTLLQATLWPAGEHVWDADRALEAIADKVASFGGQGRRARARPRLLALFGLEPEEDAPQRAAHAAIAVQRLGGAGAADDPRRAGLRGGAPHRVAARSARDGERSASTPARHDAHGALDALARRAPGTASS